VRRVAAAVALAAAGCATAGRGGAPAFAFPGAFDANQVVTVRAEGVDREFLASLRRRGDAYDVTLFDPALAVPLWSASSRGGKVTVERAEGIRASDSARLLGLLGELYAASYRDAGGGRLEARSRTAVFRLDGVRPRDGCDFPDRIAVAPRLGSAFDLKVVTLDVSCPAPAPPAG
jgi:hypothetical protein